MSSYATAFNATKTRQPFLHQAQQKPNFNEKIHKLRSKLDKKIRWNLDHNDWQLALELIVKNISRNAKQEKHASTTVITPEHFKWLLAYDAQKCASTAIPDFVRDAAASDNIPNSPSLYSDLVEHYCTSRKQPREALEIAIEGNARWRFDSSRKYQMGLSILKRCATQTNCWAVACETVQLLLNPNASSSASKTAERSGGVVISSTKQREMVQDLLGKAAYQSGLWRAVAARIATTAAAEAANGDDALQSQQQQLQQHESSTQTHQQQLPSSSHLVFWKACRDASISGEWEKAIAIFQSANTNISNNNNMSAASSHSSQQLQQQRSALHQLLNLLGQTGTWELVVKIANSWIFSKNPHYQQTKMIDDTTSNLVFASFPSPFLPHDAEEVEIIEGKADGGGETDAIVVAPSSSSAAAVALFNQWMTEVDDFSPPALTCAVMVGHWSKTEKDDDWIRNAISLLSRFTQEKFQEPSSSLSYTQSIDDATCNALQQAKALLLQKTGVSSGQQQLQQREELHEQVKALKFPTPVHFEMLHQKKLFEHRAKQWRRRQEQVENGTRSSFSRPGRQDYFPSLENKHSMLGLNDIVDDEGDMHRALTRARQLGQHRFDYDDTNVAEADDRTVMNNSRIAERNASLDTPRSGPYGKNERANGWDYYDMGGLPIFPGDRSTKVASYQHSVLPKRMKTMFSKNKNWANSSPRYQTKWVAKNYKWGTSV